MNRFKMILFTFLCLIFFVPTTWASDLTTVTVQGTSHIEVDPDQAVITLGVVSPAETAEAARANNALITNAVQQKLLSLSLTPEQISTSQFVIYPLYSNENDKSTKPPAIIGYRVSNSITIKTDDITAVGTLIDAALAAGANQVTNVRFQKKSDSDLKKSLLTEALQDAMSKANTLAAAVNKHIKKITSITEQDLHFQQPDSPRLMLKAEAMNSSVTTLSPGTITANGTISFVCELE